MASSNQKEKWKVLVEKELDNTRRKNRIIPREWQEFSDLEREVLADLEDYSVTYDSIVEKYDLKDLMRNGTKSFTLQCVYMTIKNGQQNLDDKLVRLFEQIDNWIVKDYVRGLRRSEFHQSVLLNLVENEDSESLKMMLSIISPLTFNGMQSTFNREHRYPDDNHLALMMACRKNKIELVLPLVSAGYR